MEIADPVALLTPAEREALRLYLKHSDVKLVARAIGISDHAVVKRLAGARGKLNVRRTLDAALLLARSTEEPGYMTVEVSHHGPTPADVPGAMQGGSEEGARSWRELFPSEGRPWNDLPRGVRLAWMAISLMAIMVAAILAVSLLQGVTAFVRPHR